METIKIGVIANTHGLKGEVKVKSCSGFNEERFQKGKTLYLAFQNQMVEVKVQSYRENKGFVYVSFVGLQDINTVEKYKGSEVFINKDDIHALAEDEVYYSDLLDCEVFDEEKQLIGKVTDLLETGANVVLRINETILVPYVKAFVKEVDVENKKITIHVMDGLL